MNTPTIIAIVVACIALFIIILYNTLVSKRNQVRNAFSAIDAMLKKRFDLVPNLVEVVKQYMQHESTVLEKVTNLRTHAYSPSQPVDQKIATDADLSTAVRTVMLNAENYPDLKANQNFLNLQATWTESEEQIAAARRAYNASVTDYNNSIMMFPGNLIAGIMKYRNVDVLSIPEAERQNISASKLFGSN